MLKQVRRDLKMENLSVKELLVLYKSCGYLFLSESIYERGSGKAPAVCALFDDKDVQALEFYFDLKKLYEFGCVCFVCWVD